jgi:hypothetical protein
MQLRPTYRTSFAFGLLVTLAVSAGAQDSRGRKYKAPPETSHIEVIVLKDVNKKPILNAAVVFNATKDGKSEGNLEVKTNEDGKAIIDVIPMGSSVDVQVIADGFATFADTYQVSESNRTIEIHMLKPRAQISTYVDTRGQAAQRPMGIQEPVKPSKPAQQPQTAPALTAAPGGLSYTPSKPAASQPGIPVQTNPPNMHPDNQYPVDPAAPAQTPTSTRPPATPPQS